jgi:hypothetical protein
LQIVDKYLVAEKRYAVFLSLPIMSFSEGTVL